MPEGFFIGFWNYISSLLWWQGFLIILVIILAFLIGKFGKIIFKNIGDKLFGNKTNSITLQYRMFWGLTNDALNIQMKDEVRRSFKENGFHELSGNDFSQYVKNQSKILLSIFRKHIINLYPSNKKGLIIMMDDILDLIDKKESNFEDIMFEVYTESKKLKKQYEEECIKIDEKFENEINEFSKNKTNTDCGNCITIMFGKKLIAENKKAKFKTLKSQMNFAEQKLAEIHSTFLSFYSEILNKKQEN